jgi:hypothetical protein
MAKMNERDKGYQEQKAPMGVLSVTDGMLINKRPEGMTGIQQAAMLNKSIKRAEKVSVMSEAVYLGTKRSEMDEMMNGMGGCESC